MRVHGGFRPLRSVDRSRLRAVWWILFLTAPVTGWGLAQPLPDPAGVITCSWCGEPNTGVPDVDSDADRYRNVALNCILWGIQDMHPVDPVCLAAQNVYRDQVVELRTSGVFFQVCNTNPSYPEPRPCVSVDWIPIYSSAAEWVDMHWLPDVLGDLHLPFGLVGYKTIVHLPNGTLLEETFNDAYEPPVFPITPPPPSDRSAMGLWFPKGHPNFVLNPDYLPTPTPVPPPPTVTRTATPASPPPTATRTRTPTPQPPTPTKTKTKTPTPVPPTTTRTPSRTPTRVPTHPGGGGGCIVANPSTTVLGLAGDVDHLGKGLSAPLTRIGKAENGRFIILNELEVVTGSAGLVLVVRHQGEHPADELYAPAPRAAFQSQRIEAEPEMTRSGWAAILIGTSGSVTSVELIPADGGRASEGLLQAVASGVTVEWVDERRHDVIVYVPYVVEGEEVHMPGQGLVTLPGCSGPHCN